MHMSENMSEYVDYGLQMFSMYWALMILMLQFFEVLNSLTHVLHRFPDLVAARSLETICACEPRVV